MTTPLEPAPWGGAVEPGFEPVLDAFRGGLSGFGDGGGAFAAYHDGRKVVDVWGGWARPGAPWGPDTLAVVYSVSKALTTLCLQILVDRAELDLDSRVSDIWPEFEQAGKATVRVRHVLAHTSGVLAPSDPASFLSWAGGDGWSDDERLDAGLAAATPALQPVGATFAYQAMSYGWLAAALVRRIAGKSVGRFLDAEVAEPLGLDLRIGTSPSAQGRVAHITTEPSIELPPDVAALGARIRALARDPSTLLGQAFLALPEGDLIDNVLAFNLPAMQQAEIPAVNATATARSLARLFAVLAGGGQADGVRLVSQASIDRFRTIEVHAPNALELEFDPVPSTVELHLRMLGYHGSSRPFGMPPRLGPSSTAFGHDGFGGQLAFADPERALGVGFVRSELTATPTFSSSLLDVLYGCIEGRQPGA